MSDGYKLFAEKQMIVGLEWAHGFAILYSVFRKGLTNGSQLGRDLKGVIYVVIWVRHVLIYWE